MRDETPSKHDEWFVKPHASDQIDLTQTSFKAFGRIIVWKLRHFHDEDGSSDIETEEKN